MLEMKVRLFESCITKSAFSVHSFAQVEAAVLYEQKNLNSKESGNVQLSLKQSQELDSTILAGPFYLWIFYDSSSVSTLGESALTALVCKLYL